MYLLSVFLPGLSSLVVGLFGRLIGTTGAHIVSCTLIFSCLGLSLYIAYEVIICQSSCYVYVADFINSDHININIAFNFDQITIVIIIVVGTISSLVHLYSVWYISSDPHQQRFISYLSAFTFFMIVLVTGDSYILLFIGWEGIGVLSFLLINFWTTRIQASKAAIQAITINRVGDIFLSIGFFVCLWSISNVDFMTVFSLSPYISTSILTCVGILFLLAAAGKSAQFGLHTWLVNAIEGPTPVSSILHAATLVTAGIYLLIRSSPLLEYAPISLIVILWTGAITSLFAATTGLLQNDLKRIIAYSTISQIGYLVIAVGLSQYSTALLHLGGHAYFKALLFLAAGGVLHSINDEQDLRKLGGLITLLPFTYTAILIGSLSLMAIFPLSGFYSKDLILELAHGTYTYHAQIAYIVGTIVAGITAFYSIRLILITFIGVPSASKHLYESTHDQPIIVQVPFIILILMSIFYGYIVKDVFGLGSDGLINSVFIHCNNSVIIDAEFQPLIYKLLPTVVTISSSILAIILYQSINRSLYDISQIIPSAYLFFNKKWFVDVIYSWIIYKGIGLGKLTSLEIDRGSLEVFGSRGLTNFFYSISSHITSLDTGHITTYASYILISILSLSLSTMILL